MLNSANIIITGRFDMDQGAYKKLAKKLDAIPNRYPETESGIEIRLLEEIFTPEVVLKSSVTISASC